VTSVVDIATGSVFNLSLREQISADAKRSEPTSSISTYFSRSQADLSIKCLTFRARSALVNKFDGNCHRPISTHLSCSQQTGFPLGLRLECAQLIETVLHLQHRATLLFCRKMVPHILENGSVDAFLDDVHSPANGKNI
jgi:hypothetical protein